MRSLLSCINCGHTVEEIDGDSEMEQHQPACIENLRLQLDSTIGQLYRQTTIATVWRERFHKLREQINRPKEARI